MAHRAPVHRNKLSVLGFASVKYALPARTTFYRRGEDAEILVTIDAVVAGSVTSGELTEELSTPFTASALLHEARIGFARVRKGLAFPEVDVQQPLSATGGG